MSSSIKISHNAGQYTKRMVLGADQMAETSQPCKKNMSVRAKDKQKESICDCITLTSQRTCDAQ